MTRAWLALALLVGCRVDDLELEGKACPCATGWICAVDTNTCRRLDAEPTGIDARPGSDGRDGAVVDGQVVDSSVDAVAAPSCLGGAGGGSLYTDDFGDLIGWVTRGGTWSATAGEATQTSTANGLVYAFPAGTAAFVDYRLAVRARRTAGATAGAAGLALRIQATGDGQYHCGWAPVTGALQLAWTRSNGTEGGVLAQTAVDVGAIAGYDPAAPVVVEAMVVGSQLTCCVRGLAGASVVATDTRYVAGAPGLRTTAQAVAFDDLAVDAP